MPEFILEGRDHAARTESPFVTGFLEAMFFTETSPVYDSANWSSEECRLAREEGQADGTLPGDVGYNDIHPDSLARIRAFCEAFQRDNAELLREAYSRDGYSEELAGHDLWFTSQGHGVGYWSRDELECDSEEYEELTKAMVAASQEGDDSAWDRAFRARAAIAEESLGERLSKAARYRECITSFDGKHVYVEGI